MLMDAAWEAGITHFDTADAYGGGRSERAIGRWIASRRHPPDADDEDVQPDRPEGADHGLAPEADRAPAARRASSGSGSNRVELYLAHDYDPDRPLEETFAEFERLREAGTIAAYGVSNFDGVPAVARDARRRRPPRSRTATRCSSEATRPRCCRSAPSAGRVPRLQPAGGRLADGQVPARRAYPDRLADDAAPGPVRAPAGAADVRRARGARDVRAPSAGCRWRRSRWPGCWRDDRVTPGRRRAGPPRAPGAGARGARAPLTAARARSVRDDLR